VIFVRAWKTALITDPARDQRDKEPFTLFKPNVRAEKNQGLN
jgi:hypothetical protein